MISRLKPGRRARAVASWVPALVLVPSALVVAVEVSQPDTSNPLTEVQPLEPGTTWVYDVFDHGKPSGTRVRQVLGQGQLFEDGQLQETARLSSRYDNYPGVGPRSDQIYVGLEGDEVLQYGLFLDGETRDVTPPAPAYKLPTEVGTSWSYKGKVGNQDLAFEAEVSGVGDVEVGGRTLHGCTRWSTVIQVENPDVPDATEVLTEWTCPEIGTVLYSDVYEAGDVDVTEELTAFYSPERSWVAQAPTGGPGREEAAPSEAGQASAAGFDQRRSYAVPEATLNRQLAWTESREGTSRLSPVSDSELSVVGEQDGLVSARDVDTAEVRWQVSLPPPIVATPVLAGDVVVVADGRKNLWALSSTDGAARWVHRFDDVVSDVPVVTEDLVVVPVDDGSLTALHTSDGSVEWSVDLPGRVRTPPALDGGRVVVGDDSGTLTAFEAATGATAWSAALEGGLEQGPTVAGGRVLAVDSDGILNAYAVEDGTVQWQAHGDHPAQPLAADDEVVVTVGDGGLVEAFALEDGSRRWGRTLDETAVAPVIVGDELVVVSDEGRVTVLSLSDGDRVDAWQLPSPTPDVKLSVRASPGVVADALVITAELTHVDYTSTSYAYPLSASPARAPGVVLKSQRLLFGDPIAVAPVLDGSTVYAADLSGLISRSVVQGPAKPLVDDVSPLIGFDAAQGVVVVPRGEELLAVDGKTGRKLWSFPAGEQFVYSLPAIAGDSVYVPLHGLGLVAVDLRTGEPRWTTPLLGATGSSAPLPLPHGDIAYAANGLARFDERTGREVWRLGGDLGAGVAFGPIVEDDGRIFAILVTPDATAPSGESTHAVAVAADTGRLLWDRDMEGTSSGIGPGAGSGAVVVVDGNGVASLLDAGTGEPRWTFALASIPGAQPMIHDGVVTVVERGRPEDLLQREFRVVALDVDTGHLRGSYEPPNGNETALPVVGTGPDGQLLLPTTDGAGQAVLVIEGHR